MDQPFATPGEALEHFGVKGMKWGVRKADDSMGDRAPTQKTDAEKTAARKATAKKVAIGTGVLIAAAGAAFVAYKLHQNGSLSLSSVKKATKATTPATKSAVKKVVQEPVDIIHASRGKNHGFMFLRQGGLSSTLGEYDRAGFSSTEAREFFKRYGTNNEKVAARFPDPLGRKDFAGRTIPHEVIVPASMSHGIHNIQDVIEKIWPHLKLAHDALYDIPDR